MVEYVFSEELWIKEYKKRPGGKRAWSFGDRNRAVTVTVGSKQSPLRYAEAKKKAAAALQELNFPMYKTVYLHVPMPKKKRGNKENGDGHNDAQADNA